MNANAPLPHDDAILRQLRDALRATRRANRAANSLAAALDNHPAFQTSFAANARNIFAETTTAHRSINAVVDALAHAATHPHP